MSISVAESIDEEQSLMMVELLTRNRGIFIHVGIIVHIDVGVSD